MSQGESLLPVYLPADLVQKIAGLVAADTDDERKRRRLVRGFCTATLKAAVEQPAGPPIPRGERIPQYLVCKGCGNRLRWGYTTKHEPQACLTLITCLDCIAKENRATATALQPT